MKLTPIALLALRGSTRETRVRIGKAIGVGESAVYKFIKENDDCLTKAAALVIIREITGLEDSQLLEESEPVAGE